MMFATVPKVHAPRVNAYIPYITHNTLCVLFICKVKPRSLESANDGEQSVFGEIHTSYAFGMP